MKGTIEGAASIALVALAFAFALAPPTFAGISDNILTMEACVGGSCFGYTLFTPDDPRGMLVYDPETQSWSWTLLVDVPIMSLDGQTTMGTLQAGDTHLFFGSDPTVNLNFAVEAGPDAGGTTFTIKSALLSFSTIYNATARASAAFTLTDGIDDDGATLTPLTGESGAYKSQYNGFVPDGTTFTQLIPQMTAEAMGTTNLAEDYPGGGAYEPLSGGVYDMSAQVGFTLSANDLASGTSVFEIVPEPSALALLAVALAFAGRRR
jgi:hypothetical protein